jgi:hypothetical protein
MASKSPLWEIRKRVFPDPPCTSSWRLLRTIKVSVECAMNRDVTTVTFPLSSGLNNPAFPSAASDSKPIASYQHAGRANLQ